jgi:hypothetical protein
VCNVRVVDVPLKDRFAVTSAYSGKSGLGSEDAGTIEWGAGIKAESNYARFEGCRILTTVVALSAFLLPPSPWRPARLFAEQFGSSRADIVRAVCGSQNFQNWPQNSKRRGPRRPLPLAVRLFPEQASVAGARSADTAMIAVEAIPAALDAEPIIRRFLDRLGTD